MSRLEEIKNEIAKNRNFENWEHLSMSHWLMNDIEMGLVYNEVIEKYTRECCEASLEKASENTIHFIKTYNAEHSEIKAEISDIKNIILL